MDDQYVFSDLPPISAHTAHKSSATPDEIVAIAKEIWSDISRSDVKESDDAGNEKLLTRLQAKYKDFTTSFPLVMRWMVQARKFSPKSFRKYLIKHSSADLSTREKFLDLQAEYLVLLFKEEHPKTTTRAIKIYRESIVKMLREEDKTFMAMNEEVETEMKNQQQDIDNERRNEIYRALLAKKVAKEALDTAVTIADPATAPIITDSPTSVTVAESAVEPPTITESATAATVANPAAVSTEHNQK